MKWIILILAVLVDVDAASYLLQPEYTTFLWPPPDAPPVIGTAPRVLAADGVLLSFIALIFFIRLPGRRRFFTLLPFCTLLFAALCIFYIWDYPRAWHRNGERIAAKISADLDRHTARLEQELRERQREERP